jgi:hypothetical protein
MNKAAGLSRFRIANPTRVAQAPREPREKHHPEANVQIALCQPRRCISRRLKKQGTKLPNDLESASLMKNKAERLVRGASAIVVSRSEHFAVI